MEAIRQIVDAEQLRAVLDLPKSMRYSKVEIIVLPEFSIEPKPKINKEVLKKAFGSLSRHAANSEKHNTINKTNRKALIKDLKGSLKKYANPKLISLEKKAWEMAVKDNWRKYAAT